MSQGEMAIMDPTGDTKVFWNTETPVEVESARAQFDALIRKGYRGYRVGANGEPGEIMAHFDPHAGVLIMRPPMVGG